MVVTDKVEGKGGIQIQVLSLGTSRGREQQGAHKIKLKLSAVDGAVIGLYPVEWLPSSDIGSEIIFIEEDK